MKRLITVVLIALFAFPTLAQSFSIDFEYDVETNTLTLVIEGFDLSVLPQINFGNGEQIYAYRPVAEEASAGDDEAEFDEFRAVVMNSPVGYALRCRTSTDTSSTNNIVVAMTNGTTATVVDIFRDGRHEWWQLEDIVTANGEEIEGPCVAASGTDSEKWLDLIAED